MTWKAGAAGLAIFEDKLLAIFTGDVLKKAAVDGEVVVFRDLESMRATKIDVDANQDIIDAVTDAFDGVTPKLSDLNKVFTRVNRRTNNVLTGTSDVKVNRVWAEGEGKKLLHIIRYMRNSLRRSSCPRSQAARLHKSC